jgi:acyl carrier protein
MSADDAEFETRLASCFATALPGTSDAEIREAKLDVTPGWDSATTLTLISLIEEEFGCTLSFDRAAEMVSFDAVAAIVRPVV